MVTQSIRSVLAHAQLLLASSSTAFIAALTLTSSQTHRPLVRLSSFFLPSGVFVSVLHSVVTIAGDGLLDSQLTRFNCSHSIWTEPSEPAVMMVVVTASEQPLVRAPPAVSYFFFSRGQILPSYLPLIRSTRVSVRPGGRGGRVQ